MDEKSLDIREFCKKMLVVIALTIFVIFYSKLCSRDADAALEKYDYSQVSAVQATVLNTYTNHNMNSNGTGGTSKTVQLLLEDGKEISIAIGGASAPSDGEKVTIYTDGYDYSFTERGVAIQNTKGYFANTFVPCILIIALFVFIIGYIKGWQGVLIAIGAMLFIFKMS